MTGSVRLLGVGAALAAVLAIASCAVSRPASTAAAVPSVPACRQPPPAVLPHSAGSLDETSSGAYCLPAGDNIAVFLHAGAGPSTAWAAITSSNPQILEPQPSGVLTAPLGVTPGIFAGTRAGVATLSSTAANGRAWTVTIVVG
jgi:hypothetical protein